MKVWTNPGPQLCRRRGPGVFWPEWRCNDKMTQVSRRCRHALETYFIILKKSCYLKWNTLKILNTELLFRIYTNTNTDVPACSTISLVFSPSRCARTYSAQTLLFIYCLTITIRMQWGVKWSVLNVLLTYTTSRNSCKKTRCWQLQPVQLFQADHHTVDKNQHRLFDDLHPLMEIITRRSVFFSRLA